MLTISFHQKSSIFLVLILDAVQIRRNFFPLGHPPYAKKSKRESLYFDLLPGPLRSATLFYLFIYLIKEKRKIIVDTNFLFVCTLTHLIKFFYWYMATFTRDHKNISLTQEHITEQGWNKFKKTKRFTKSKGWNNLSVGTIITKS